MFIIVVIAAFAALAVDARFLSRAPELNGRIVGGVDANIEDYSYHVAVQFRGTYRCGGSIIGVYKMILTAAHCTAPISDSTKMSVRYGTSLREEGGSVLNVSEVFQHPRYNSFTLEYDISVLKLDGLILFSAQVNPIILVSPDVQEGGRSAWVTGWGQIYSGGPLSEQLQAVEVQEVNRDECRRLNGNRITSRTICFIDDGKDACRSDSGGPLVTGNRQIGVVSWGHLCGNVRRPGVYANIHNRDIADYIASIMREHDSA